jgi:serine/threonine-protein kinase HipA
MDIDIHLNGSWHPCASVNLRDTAQASRRGGVTLRYDAEYALRNLQARDFRALSVRAPVDLGIRTVPQWPSFLIDLLPQGAARKRLERGLDSALSEWSLLERGAVNPVGNLRVRPVAPEERRSHPGFDLKDMITRGDAFIDHAYEVGAMVAGSTDIQGEAPKFWVVEDDGGRWHPDDGHLGGIARRYALLKFPLPEAGQRATDILRHEAAYQRVAARLGLRVTPELPQFIDGALLIPRFDRRRTDRSEIRLGVESLYSVAGIVDSAQTPLRHHEALIALYGCLTDFDGEILEYFRRDILNLAMGNRDNHGRNTAILKDPVGSMRLAPIFDFGPAFLDARAIVRTMHWDGEQSDQTNWNTVLMNLATRFEDANLVLAGVTEIAKALAAFAQDLEHLPNLMRECGVDGAIIEQRRAPIESLARALDKVTVP